MNLQDIDWPAFGLEDDVRPALQSLRRAGEPAVLATLFAAEGGSPRGVGTQMLFGRDLVTGYLSGGCVEADVALHAGEVMASGEPRRLVYGPGGPADVRLPCGGRIEVLLERLAPDDPASGRLLELWEARRPALWITDGRLRACVAEREALPPGSPLAAGLRLGAQGEVCAAAEPLLVARRHDPTQRLVVIGADPPALAMAALGRQLGFETTFVRPKGPARPPPLEGVRYLRASPSEALRQVGLDAWTAVAVATHDAELDQEALTTALASPAGYVGVLGSRRKLPDRLQALGAAGVAERDLQRLKAPIGLPLAGKSPWEIAVAVIGEIVQAARLREQAEAWPGPQTPGRPLHALVLAAGQGARYGGPKLLAPWRGAAVLDAALAAAFAAPAASVILVTGAHREEVEAAGRAFAAARPDGGRLRLAHAPHHAQGLSASMRRGIEALPEDAEGVFIFLGDMPRAPPAVLRPLADALAGGAAAAAPVFQGRRGHPVLVSKSLFPALMAVEGDRGAAAVLGGLGSALALIECDDDGVLFDVDRPEDLQPSPARESA